MSSLGQASPHLGAVSTMYATPGPCDSTRGFYGRGKQRLLPPQPGGRQKGLSVAFDLATHRGYRQRPSACSGGRGQGGCGHRQRRGHEAPFEGIPLDQMSVSMTMNGAVLPILAFYIVAAEEQGVGRDS